MKKYKSSNWVLSFKFIILVGFMSVQSSSANSYIDVNNNAVDDRLEVVYNSIYNDSETLLVIYQVQRAFYYTFEVARYFFDDKYKNLFDIKAPDASINQIAQAIANDSGDFNLFMNNANLMANSLACIDYQFQKKQVLGNQDQIEQVKKSARAESLDKETMKQNRIYSSYMNSLSNSPALKPMVNQLFSNLSKENTKQFCDGVLAGNAYAIRKP